MANFIADLHSVPLLTFVGILGLGVLVISIGPRIARWKQRLAMAKEHHFEIERKMAMALRQDEIEQEQMCRELVRLEVQIAVLGGRPLTSQLSDEIRETVTEVIDEGDELVDPLLVDLLGTGARPKRTYTVAVSSSSPAAQRARFRCKDTSRALRSERINLLAFELTSGTKLIASNCHPTYGEGRWVFEARLPPLPALDGIALPRAFHRRDCDWIKFLEPDGIPLTDRQRAFDELVGWFLRIVEGKEALTGRGFAFTVANWDHYQDPLPYYEGQRVYRRRTLEEP